jgi:hypothetical protein
MNDNKIEAIFVNQAITTSGSFVYRAGAVAEVTLIWNITGPVTGTAPALTFRIEEIDPSDESTVVGQNTSSDTIRTVGSGYITLPTNVSQTTLISWTLTGTSPSFAGAYVTILSRIPTAMSVITNSSYLPDPAGVYGDPQQVISDPSGQLAVRSTVLTDEGSFRDDFSGDSLLSNLTGVYSFTSGSTLVLGNNALFTTELTTDRYIRLSSHNDSVLAKISYIISDAQLILEEPYVGPTASGSAITSYWLIQKPNSPANISLGSDSILSVTARTTSGDNCGIYRNGDYQPFTMNIVCRVSQRVANQKSVIGFQDEPFNPQEQAVFVFDGTDNTKVKCITSFADDSVQETLATYPGSLTSTVDVVYEIQAAADRCRFLINGTQIAEHRTHVYRPYTSMYQVAYIQNIGTVGSQTILYVDSVYFQNKDVLSLDEPVAVAGVASGQPITVQFGNPGGTTSLPFLINLNFNKSEGSILANAYKRVSTYTIPTGHTGYLIKFVSYQGEVAVSRVVAEQNLGAHVNSTNVFTAGTPYTSPQWAAIVQAEVKTAYASGAGNVVLTVTYTNELGVASRTGTITIPRGSVIGARFDLVLQGSDLGVRSIQNISGTPTVAGTCNILGLLQLALHQDQSTTTQTETLYAPGAITFPAGTVLGLEYAGGTVSKARLIDILVQLVQ